MGNRKKTIETDGSSALSYSNVDFIALVKTQPILWNHNHPDFNTRGKRLEAWHNVARQLLPNLNGCSVIEQSQIITTLSKRWKNTRDCFLRAMRAHKTEMNADPQQCSYVYSKQMAFLLDEHANATTTTAAAAKIEPAETETEFCVVSVRSDNKQQSKNRLTTKRLQRVPKEESLNSCEDSDNDDESDNDAEIIELQLEQNLSELEDQLELSGDFINEEDLQKQVKRQQAFKRTISQVTAAAAPTTSKIKKFMPKKVDNQKSSTTADVDLKFNSSSNANTSSMQFSPASTAAQPSCIYIPSYQTQAQATRMHQVPGQVCNCFHLDPDQAIFDSIKPHMRNMTDAEKLDFQIEMLNLLRSKNKK